MSDFQLGFKFLGGGSDTFSKSFLKCLRSSFFSNHLFSNCLRPSLAISQSLQDGCYAAFSVSDKNYGNAYNNIVLMMTWVDRWIINKSSITA